MGFNTRPTRTRGFTLVELVIVLGVIGILVATAAPGYSSYLLRVHRSEAIRMLLQASNCQERIRASRGSYDTDLCRPVSERQRYQLSYQPVEVPGKTFLAIATPVGPQSADPCGSLSLDQDGRRGIGNAETSVVKCWNGR